MIVYALLKIIAGAGLFSFLATPTFNAPLAASAKSAARNQALFTQQGGDIQNQETLDGKDAFSGLPIAKTRSNLSPRRKPDASSDKLALTAQAYAVIDKNTENLLAGKNADAVRAIGSISKLMTAMVFLKLQPAWDKVMTMEEADGRQGRLYVGTGDKMLVKDLFHLSLVGSSNNATIALARSTGLSMPEFVDQMNQEARSLGLQHTTFVEPTGLDARNKSTAREVALLLKAALKEQKIKDAVSLKKYDFKLLDQNDRETAALVRVNSTDLLLGDSNGYKQFAIAGGKTGYIEEAGYSFDVETEDTHGHSIIVAVLGSSTTYSRFSEAKMLAEWAYSSYVWAGQDGYDKAVAIDQQAAKD